jgi:D-glycero-D-manno-heptose 1,7-bisphosphate phosphatase
MGTGIPAVFLDRDGVLVVPEFRDGRSYAPRDLENYAFYPDAAASVAALKEAGFLTIVVTNQPDIGAGLISAQTVDEMHRMLEQAMPVDAIRVCAHTRADKCDCRKPAPGLLLKAAEEFGIDLDRSYMIGDRSSDVEAGKAAGCRTIFIDLGYTAEPRPQDADWVVDSLAEAAAIIREHAAQGEAVHGSH